MQTQTALEESLKEREQVRARLWASNRRGTALKLSWRASAVKHSFHILPGETVLELGAGDGTWTAVLASQLRNENQITGAVFSEELFKVALSRDIPCARFVRITNLSRDLVSHSFDYVVGSMMLFHELLPEMLFAIHRLLKPGGQILFFEHNHRHPGRRLASRLKPGERGNGGLFPYITDQRVLKTCSHQGFTHVELAQYDFVPWGFKEGASRAVQAKAVLLEHAPYIRVLSGGAYLWARVPGERNPVLPNLAVHEALFGSVSFVIPCHNEEQNIARLVGRILALYRPYVHELLLINDNSSDSTRRVAEQLAAAEPLVRVWNRQKPNGVGLALKDGYQLATGRFILSMDCDFVEILPEFRALFDAVAAGHEGAIGSRFSHDSILINYPFLKMVCNRLFHLIIKLFLVSRARDVSNNLKLYRAEIFKELEIESPHFSANLETGLKPLLAGFDIVEVPISWINRTVGMGTSSFKVGTVGPDYARALIRILRQHWFKRPISSIVQKPPLGASAPHPVVPTSPAMMNAATGPGVASNAGHASGLVRQLIAGAEKVAASRLWILALFTLFYVVPTVRLTRIKLFWDDEFFTLYLSRIPSWTSLLQALATGADQHPPTFYYLTHSITQVLGTVTSRYE